jgi:hypothetical protein
VFRTVIAGGTISQGDPVIWNTTTSYDGMTVIACAANTMVVGVACHDAIAGGALRLQTSGSIADGCGFVTTDGGVTAGQGLFPTTAVADSGTLATVMAAGTCFGYAAAADSGTELSSGHLFCRG